MNNVIATKEFTSEIVREYSCTSKVDELGKYNCKMELCRGNQGNLYIEWTGTAPHDEEGIYEVIGIENEGMTVTGYDGVFEIPKEAIELLNQAGYNTEEIE